MGQKKEKQSRDVQLTVQIAEKSSDGKTITFKEETKKFGLLEDNREVDIRRVNLFAALIKDNKYRNECPIMCYKAENLSSLGIKITNFDGKPIDSANLAEYLIIADGQHRIAAFISRNKEVPNVHIIKAESSDDVLKFLASINRAGKDWTNSDRLSVAKNLNNHYIDKINEVIKEYKFSQSTAQQIYLGKKLSKSSFFSLLDGTLNLDSIVTEGRIKIGDDFVNVCFELSEKNKEKMKLFSKRYFIEGINQKILSGDSLEKLIDEMKKMKYENLEQVKKPEDFIKLLK